MHKPARKLGRYVQVACFALAYAQACVLLCVEILSSSFPALLKQLGDEPGPSGLMTCASAGAVVAVEVFIK